MEISLFLKFISNYNKKEFNKNFNNDCRNYIDSSVFLNLKILVKFLIYNLLLRGQ